MKRIAILFLCSSALLIQAQVPAKMPDRSEWDAFYARQEKYRREGTKALEKERTRSKADLCIAAESGGNAAISERLMKEAKTTEADYVAYIRSIGALMRLAAPGESEPARITRLSFDSAEAAWQKYREEGCRSVDSQWDRGDQAQVAYPDCLLRVTWDHMNELAKLYNDLWH